MNLYELLNSPVKHKWIENSKTRKVAAFTAGGREFAVNLHDAGTLEHNNNTIWMVEFHPTDTKSDEYTGDGNAHEIMSTVVAIIEDAVNTKGVKAMDVGAKLKDAGRLLLYKRLVQKLTKKFGWKIYGVDEYDSKREWTIGEK